MTLAPVDEQYLLEGLEGEPYKVGPNCANPSCRRFADHAHHIWRRSADKPGGSPWLRIGDHVVGNLTGLCHRCHEDVDGGLGGHSAAIRWNAHDKRFYWCRVEGPPSDLTFHKTAPLDPQPPTPDSLSAEDPGQGTESEHCPFCGQTRRRRMPSPPGPRRRRKNWVVSVPDDSEDGADVLDVFVDDVADLLGAGDWAEHNRRYWALVHALAWVMQRRAEFEKDVRAAA